MSARTRTILTARDQVLFALLVRARWLSSEQVRRRLFPAASANAVQKRLRKLTRAGFLYAVRLGPTEPSYFRLTALGGSVAGTSEPAERRLPAQVCHFSLINDLRLWFEMRTEIALQGFWAEWEYRPFNTREAIVPDALVAVLVKECVRRFAIEVDCATENATILAKKVSRYARATPDDREMSGLLIWVPGARRIRAVVAACYRMGAAYGSLPCWIGDLEQLHAMDVRSRRLLNLAGVNDGDQPVYQSLGEVLAPPVEPSCREEGDFAITQTAMTGCQNGNVAIYASTRMRPPREN